MGFLRKHLRQQFEDKRPKDVLAADIRMISGCEDEQTSADVSNVADFQLPDPAGRAGGACTSAILDVLYKDGQTPEDTLSFVQVLTQMRGVLKNKGFEQIPQLTSSHPVDVELDFTLVPPTSTGTKRAVLIGINYVGDTSQLSGCHNDALNMVEFIKNVYGFEDDNIKILMDDGDHVSPTRENILAAYREIAETSEPGDAIFLHYSGHGAKIPDKSGDEGSGYDQTLVPLDYKEAGLIVDDELHEVLVKPLKEGVTMFCLMDCCHSGTVLDLPYVFKGDGSFNQMEISEDFDFQKLLTKFGQTMDTVFAD